jgi:hypothetical protein
MTIRNEVEEMIGSVLVRLDDGSLDPNAFCRCMFRCWLDGSYDGAETYQANVSELKRIVFEGVQFIPPLPRTGFTTREGIVVTASEIAADDEGGKYAPHGSSDWMDRERWLRRVAKQLRSWVIGQFTAYVTREVRCCRVSTAQRYIVSATSAEDLAELTGELIDDALDLICDDVSDQLRSDIIDAYSDRYGADPVVVGVQAVQA